MCGIIAVVRRPSDRPVPDRDAVVGPLRVATDLLGALPEAGPLPEDLARPSRRGRRGGGRRRPAAAGRARRAGAARRRRGGQPPSPSWPGASSGRAGRWRPASTPTAGCRAPSSRRSTPRSSPSRTRCGRCAATGCGPRRASPASSGPAAGPGRRRRRPLDAPGPLGDRPARGPRPRQRRASTCWCAATASTSASPALQAVLEQRAADPLFGSMAVRTPEGHLGFVYKAAAEIGELGDNTTALRAAIAADGLLQPGAAQPDRPRRSVLGHTRWASVGIISQPNAHPLNSEEVDARRRRLRHRGAQRRRRQLRRPEGGRGPAHRRRDHHRRQGDPHPHLAGDGRRHRRRSRRSADGRTGSRGRWPSPPARRRRPSDLLLALRGSGQALYVGLAEDAFVVASEPYGVVEETDTYLRMDGEVPADPANPASRGQVVRLHATGAGHGRGHRALGLRRHRRAGGGRRAGPRPDHHPRHRPGRRPHFLLKEIGEAPSSFRKTLRGKLVDGRRRPRGPTSAPTCSPDEVRARARRRAPSTGSSPSGRAPPRWPLGRWSRRCAAFAPDLPPAGRVRPRHRAVRASTCASRWPTPSSWR